MNPIQLDDWQLSPGGPSGWWKGDAVGVCRCGQSVSPRRTQITLTLWGSPQRFHLQRRPVFIFFLLEYFTKITAARKRNWRSNYKHILFLGNKQRGKKGSKSHTSVLHVCIKCILSVDLALAPVIGSVIQHFSDHQNQTERITKHWYFVFISTTLLLILISVLTWEVTKYIYSGTVQVHIQGALLEYFHFVKLYIEVCTPLYLTEGSSYWLLFRLHCCPMKTTEVLMLNVCVKLTALLKEPKSHTRVMLIPVSKAQVKVNDLCQLMIRISVCYLHVKNTFTNAT